MMMRWLDLAEKRGSERAAFILAGFHLAHAKRRPEAEVRGRAYLARAAKGLNDAREVLKEERAGRSLTAAYQYVVKTAYENRYVERARSAPAVASGSHVQPRVVDVVKAEFPAGLRFTGNTGEAMIRFVVRSDGAVAKVSVVSATHPAFGEAAAAAVEQWQFEPGRVDGRAVNTRMQVPIYFKLEE